MNRAVLGFVLVSLCWTSLLLPLGLWNVTRDARPGIMSYTYEVWETLPPNRHAFLGVFVPSNVPNRQAYHSFTYPFLFANFAVLAPFRYVLGVPWVLAQNALAFICAAILLGVFFFAAREELYALAAERSPLLWLFGTVAVGIIATDPMPWICLTRYNRENLHVIAAGVFCYLSTFAFREQVPTRAFLFSGLFLACWGPMYLPAWILAGLFFNRSLRIEKRWLMQVIIVGAIGVLNFALPAIACKVTGLTPVGSGFLYRSGLDGDSTYMTSIFQAVIAPHNPRRWPTLAYVGLAALMAIAFERYFRKRGVTAARPLRQAGFLLIPYATLAIAFPQFTSIHPQAADMQLLVPATFAIAYWLLQPAYWRGFTGPTWVRAMLVGGIVLMTNLLAVAANWYRFGPLASR